MSDILATNMKMNKHGVRNSETQRTYLYEFKMLRSLLSIREMQQLDINRHQVEDIIVLPYFINTNATVPFIMYLLKRDNNLLHFIQGNSELLTTQNDIVNNVDECQMLLKEEMNKTNTKCTINLKGLTCIGRTFVCVFQIILEYVDMLTMYSSIHSSRNSDVELVTVTELLNETYVNNLRIHKDVVAMFTNNIELCVLHDENHMIYETPSIAYTLSPASKIEFESLFGGMPLCIDMYNQKPHYYFGMYSDKLLQAIALQEEQHMGYGLIRYAIFLGNNTVLLDLLSGSRPTYIWDSDRFDSATILNAPSGNTIYAIKARKHFTTLSFHNI